MRLVFAGTPDFAVPSLEALAAAGHRLALVITQPDRPAGRHRRPTPPPIRKAAEALGLPVLQTPNINARRAVEAIRRAEPDAVVVVAFGQRFGRSLLHLPSNGCINLHASLLPRLRGAAPVPWAILNGDRRTGVTTQRMAEEIDAGDILLQEAVAIGETETAGELFERLAPLGAKLLVRTIEGLEAGRIVPTPQDHGLATPAPMLRKEDGLVDWRRPAESVRDFVRGMTPWPSAYTFLRRPGAPAERITLHGLQVEDMAPAPAHPPGRVLFAGRERLIVAAGSGAVRVVRLQRAGGRPLDAPAFLRGHPLHAGDSFHAAP